MEQFQNIIQQQQQQIQALQQQVQQVQHIASASAAAAASSSASAKVHRGDESDHHFGLNRLLSKPSQFNGEHGDLVYDWINEMDMLFENCDASVSEPRKVVFAKQQLRGEALRWWVNLEHEANRPRASGANDQDAPKHITTWAEFKAALLEYFSPRGASEEARSQLHELRQYKFRDLAAYIEAFEKTARRIEVPPGHSIDEELVGDFKHGLSDGYVRLFLTSNHPKTLLQATRLALQAESDLKVSGMHSMPRGRSLTLYRGDNRRSSDRFFGSRPSSNFQSAWNRSRFSSAPPSRVTQERSSGPTPMELGSLTSALDEGDETERAESGSDRSGESDHEPESGSESMADRQDPQHELEPVCDNCGCNTLTMRPKRSVGPPVCWNCGQVGHVQRDCKAAPKRRLVEGIPRPGSVRDNSKGSDGRRRSNFH